jgi:hypothetical protein
MRNKRAEIIANRYLNQLSIFDKLPVKNLRVSQRELIKISSALGDCYKANGKYFLDNMYAEPNLRLVHGEVMGQGELSGISYGHCWCELDGMVLDFSNGRNIELDKRLYYALGQIDRLNNLHTYDQETFSEKISKFGTWGPWDLKTKTGL